MRVILRDGHCSFGGGREHNTPLSPLFRSSPEVPMLVLQHSSCCSFRVISVHCRNLQISTFVPFISDSIILNLCVVFDCLSASPHPRAKLCESIDLAFTGLSYIWYKLIITTCHCGMKVFCLHQRCSIEVSGIY